MVCADVEEGGANTHVAATFVNGEPCHVSVDRIDQAVLINERQDNNALVSILFAVEINLKFVGVEVVDGRVGVTHQIPETLGKAAT